MAGFLRRAWETGNFSSKGSCCRLLLRTFLYCSRSERRGLYICSHWHCCSFLGGCRWVADFHVGSDRVEDLSGGESFLSGLASAAAVCLLMAGIVIPSFGAVLKMDEFSMSRNLSKGRGRMVDGI